jgi:hypothetical protein
MSDLQTNPEPYPCALGVYCDCCFDEWEGDFIVTDADTRETRMEIVREYVRQNENWRCDDKGDYCPACRIEEARGIA